MSATLSLVALDMADKTCPCWAVVFGGHLLPGRFRTEEEAVDHLQDMKRGDVLSDAARGAYAA